ncbi:UDP-glycosyltransferase UGT5-like [Eurosta solidaginis]|uniref:UDP-glycosyltransferase UGT5-like n=1 Tax=Eurosta solidaginis TaxID=178769 RepID=UPI003530B175
MHIFENTVYIFVILAFALNCLECAKILSVFPFTGPSEYLCVEPLLKKLAERGHEVTSVTTFPQKTPLKNFRDIVLKNENEHHDEFVVTAMDDMSGSRLSVLRSIEEYVLMGTESIMKSKEFHHLLNKEQFDLVIIEVLFIDSIYALGHHFKAPMIGVATFGTDVVIDQLVDNISPIAYVPAPSGTNMDDMNFWQRLDNLYISTFELLYNHLVIIPQHQRLYEKYFPKPTLSLSDVRRDFSLLLLNQHHSLSWSRPYVLNAIEVAGMHINHKLNQLPIDMENFINDSANGAIYFSLGSNVKSASLPKSKLEDLMAVFATLPVNVLWKFEKPDLPGKPKNIFINKWFPQPDVLAHPKVKLFITHSGMHSYIETVHHAKPIVAMPILYDQRLNAASAQAKGLGLVVNFKNFTRDELRSAILEVLNNPKYSENARQLSARYHDRPMSALDTAIYWTEYVLRHKGAPHLRVKARKLNFWQRNSVDTMAVLFGIPLLVMIFVIVAICKTVKRVLFAKVPGTAKENKTKQKRE